jgi:hypothetical protein
MVLNMRIRRHNDSFHARTRAFEEGRSFPLPRRFRKELDLTQLLANRKHLI